MAIGGPRIYVCKCGSPLASKQHLMSKNFKGKSGQAYLFSHVTNITYGEEEVKTMLSGVFKVRDVICSHCFITLGWKYEFAYTESQKYKEGSFILEKAFFA